MAISILIVDDHAMIRKLLRRHLEIQEEFIVVGEATDGRDGIAQAEALLPDVILMDVAMPVIDGIEATRVIHGRLPQVKVLMLTLYSSSDNCARSVDSGAMGYILKESVDEEVVTAIHAIMKGNHYFGGGVANPLVSLMPGGRV